MVKHHLLVGTFKAPVLYTLQFDAEQRTLEVVAETEASGAHSWLSLSASLHTHHTSSHRLGL